MKIKDELLRNMYRKICYIDLDAKKLKKISGWKYEKNATGILTIGYIDHEAGLTFEMLCYASCDGNKINCFAGNPSTSMKFRYGSIKDFNVQCVDIEQINIEEFLDKFEMIISGYDSDQDILAVRDLEILDGSRNKDNPDDVSVIFIKDGVYREACWVRCEKLGDHEIIGTLLNEPYQDFDVHQYDEVRFALAETEDGYVCVALL